MMFDKQNSFSEAQDLSGVAATTQSTNVIDQYGGVATAGIGAGYDNNGNVLVRDLGRCEEVELVAQMVVAAAGGTAIDFQLIGSNELTGGAMSSVTVLASTGAIVDATLVKGYRARLRLPPTVAGYRYIGLQYVKTGTHTAGAVTAGLVGDGGIESAPGSFS